MRFATLSFLFVYSTIVLAGDNEHSHHEEHEEFKEHEAHLHGHGEAYISIEDQVAKVTFILPSIDVFGFEHDPLNEQQHNTVDTQLKLLENSQNIILMGSSCKQTHIEINSGVNSEDHGHEEDHRYEGSETHSNVTVAYELQCETNHDENIIFSIFKTFPSIEKIVVKYVSDDIQTSAALTPDSPTFHIP